MNLNDGEEVWRVSREGVSERSWATPLIVAGQGGAQVVVNGWPVVMSYDLETGAELWRIRDGGDNPIPTPFLANGWIYIASAYGPKSPIYVIRGSAGRYYAHPGSTFQCGVGLECDEGPHPPLEDVHKASFP